MNCGVRASARAATMRSWCSWILSTRPRFAVVHRWRSGHPRHLAPKVAWPMGLMRVLIWFGQIAVRAMVSMTDKVPRIYCHSLERTRDALEIIRIANGLSSPFQLFSYGFTTFRLPAVHIRIKLQSVHMVREDHH